MSPRRFAQLDVFGSPSGFGNPLAVVLDAEDLDTATMQAFAHWTNLSETTFVTAPTTDEADYRVRIFTASEELPFAGHPTLGSAAAWLGAGGTPREEIIVQECRAGLVPLRRGGDRLAFRAPPLTRHEPVAEELVIRIASGLGLAPDAVLDAAWIVNGPQWIGLRLADAATVLGLRAESGPLAWPYVGVIGPHPAGGEVDVEVRAFCSDPSGVVEDPVTGSLNAGLAQWLIGSGELPARYLAAQGTRLGRAGRVQLQQEDSGLWVAGAVRSLITGTVDL